VIKNASANVGEKTREATLELVSDAFKESHEENYLQSMAAVFAALSIHDNLVDPIVRAHLLAGTPPSVLSSYSIVAFLSTEDGTPLASVPKPFRSVLPSIAQKIQESIGTEKPNIARPAREAKELLRKLDDSLFGS